jgi:2-polyprenyl-6-hydroxyphenyl methylase/3-demethylubiquinone-9 3-methyltransferase
VAKRIVRNDLEFYDQSAEKWWHPDAKIYALHHLNPLRFEYFDRHITNWQGLKVLDVGCGGGFSCEFVAARQAQVYGIDRAQNCIAIAKAHAASNGFEIDYQTGFAESLPYPDNYFDVVLCVDVLEHIADLNQTIAEIHRVLKPGGVFCFDTINRTFRSHLITIWLLEEILEEIPRGIHDWKKFIKPEELTDLMQHNGLSNFEIKGFNLFGNTIWDYFAAYRRYKKTGGFSVSLNENTSVMYIGKAEKGKKVT